MSQKPVPAHYSDEDYGSQDNHDGPDQESAGFLSGLHLKSHLNRDSTWQSKRCLILVTLLNVFLFSTSAILLGTWYHQNYLTKNPELRHISIYSEFCGTISTSIK